MRTAKLAEQNKKHTKDPVRLIDLKIYRKCNLPNGKWLHYYHHHHHG